LKKLDLSLGGVGKLGLGSNNLLFIACELLLLAENEAGTKALANRGARSTSSRAAPITSDEVFAGSRDDE
jgi:hypothetical protein